jgi:oxaloacetate decarboxylase alpha subunit
MELVTPTRRKARKGANVKSRPAAADNAGGVRPAGFELTELRQLIRLVQRTGIGELEVSSGGRTVRISAHGNASAVITGPQVASPSALAPAPPEKAPEATDHLKAITSPMVGTFYRAPAPDADPYVEVGTSVEVGQTVCIIEAMKLMNEIESEVKGRIVQILVENAQPVEFGQKLFLVEPA